MWLAVDKDGWGKLFRHCPTRDAGIWLGTGECEPKLLINETDKKTGRTWRDEPIKVTVDYEIKIYDEQQ